MRARVLAGAFAALIVAAACASESNPAGIARRVTQEVMSPFCDGLTIHDCPSAQSEQLRFEIFEMARSGMSRDAIVDDLVARYGERIRGVPEREGTGLILWMLPGAGVIAGAIAALLLARRFSRRPPSPQIEPAHDLNDEERARLEAELAALREER